MSPDGATGAVGRLGPGVVHGAIRPPSSKSLTHRACAIALLARERFEIVDPLRAEDTELFFAALETLGFEVARGAERVTIEPGAAPRAGRIECGNAGTLFRFLTALTTTVPGRWELDGTPRLRERPVGPLVEALRALGASVECPRAEGFAPLTVEGGTLSGGAIALDAGASSQYLSALLLAGQGARGPIEIEVRELVSAPYVDLTVDLLREFGGVVERRGRPGFRTGPSRLRGGSYRVEADLSAAAYPAAAAALSGGEVVLESVSLASRQGDARLFALLGAMGAKVEERDGGVRIRGGALRALDVDAADIPDQVPTLAALAPFALGTTRITNVAHLRIKESDRLAAMAEELRRSGAQAEELPDGLVVPGRWAASEPPTRYRPARRPPDRDGDGARRSAAAGARGARSRRGREVVARLLGRDEEARGAAMRPATARCVPWARVGAMQPGRAQ